MAVLGLLTHVLPDVRAIHWQPGEFRHDACGGSAVSKFTRYTRNRLLLLPTALLCMHGHDIDGRLVL